MLIHDMSFMYGTSHLDLLGNVLPIVVQCVPYDGAYMFKGLMYHLPVASTGTCTCT